MTTEAVDAADGADVRWLAENSWFSAALPGRHEINIDEPAPVGANHGPRPTDLLLAAAASCSAISAVSLFKKMRQPVTALSVHASGTRQAEWPKAFTEIMLDFEVGVGVGASEPLIQKAIELAVRRYCPVSATIEMGTGAAAVDYRVRIAQDIAPSAI